MGTTLKSSPCVDLETVGLAYSDDGETRHVAILYRDEGAVKICELYWHYWLRNQIAEGNYWWDKCDWLDDDNATALIARLITISPECKIPYGFTYHGRHFNQNLEPQLFDAGEGLTCASFVLAIFEAFAFQLLDCQNWRARPEDEEWQKSIISAMEYRNKAQSDAMKDSIGAFRYRPEEVMAAGISAEIPLSFDDAVRQASILIAETDAAAKASSASTGTRSS